MTSSFQCGYSSTSCLCGRPRPSSHATATSYCARYQLLSFTARFRLPRSCSQVSQGPYPSRTCRSSHQRCQYGAGFFLTMERSSPSPSLSVAETRHGWKILRTTCTSRIASSASISRCNTPFSPSRTGHSKSKSISRLFSACSKSSRTYRRSKWNSIIRSEAWDLVPLRRV